MTGRVDLPERLGSRRMLHKGLEEGKVLPEGLEERKVLPKD